jgi:hypothetical protein
MFAENEKKLIIIIIIINYRATQQIWKKVAQIFFFFSTPSKSVLKWKKDNVLNLKISLIKWI